MIDPDLIAAMKNVHEPWNEKISDGLVISEISKVPGYIDQVCRQAFKGLEPLRYVGYRTTDPREAFVEITRPRGNRNLYEQAKSTTVLYRFEFEFDGKPMRPRYLYLPYVDSDGLLRIKDSRYVYSPTIADKNFSVEEGRVFIPITRSPVTVYRNNYYYNEGAVLKTADIHCSRLHYTKKDEAPKSLHPQLMHYLFCMMGVEETYRFMGIEARAIAPEDYSVEKYPVEEWTPCYSSGIKPKTRIPGYVRPSTVLLVKNDCLTQTNRSFIASFFYVIDNCAALEFMKPELMNEVFVWQRSLVKFIWKAADSLEAIDDIRAHLESLEEYLDEIVRNRLLSDNIAVDDIWELFRYVLQNYHEMTITSNPASVLNKQLRIVEPMTMNITVMINNLMFALRKLRLKNYRIDTVEDLFNRGFKQNEIVKLADGHPEVSLVESATDSKAMKITSLIYRPSRNTGSASAADMQNPMFALDPDCLDAFSLRMVTKSSPPASNRVRPNIKLGPNNEILADPEVAPFREELRRLK